MGKLDYLDALKRALIGLPPELQARTLAWYEQRFVDGIAAGRPEQDIAKELDDPKKVALTLRANTHMHAFAQQKNPANLVRVLVSVLGLLIFNLFMVIPAAVVGSLLAALYLGAFAFYIGGIALTASGLSGANELVLDGPLGQVIQGDRRSRGDNVATRVSIDESGIEVTRESREPEPGDTEPAEPDPDADADPTARAVRQAERAAERALAGAERAAEQAAASAERAAEQAAAGAERAAARANEQAAGTIDGGRVRITTGMDDESRTTQAALGLAAVLGGIVLFLLSLVLTRYAALGIRRYVQMNLSLLKGA